MDHHLGRARHGVATAGILAALALAAGACSSGTDAARTSAAGNAAEGKAVGGGAVSADAMADGAATPAAAEPAPLSEQQLQATDAAIDRSVIRTATVTIDVDALDPAVASVKAAATDLDGFVFAEETALGAHATSTLTLKVAPDDFDPLLERLRPLGTLASQDITTDDVTDQIVDVDARIAAAEESLARSAGLLDKAGTVADLTIADAEVTRRQTELERLRAQKASLERQVALSTVVVTLRSEATVAPAVAEQQDAPRPGFGDGLDRGVGAVGAIASALAVLAGVALPFLPLAVAAVVIVALLRRRRRPSATQPV
ncbi:MAG: DUF4349 domain-containing protein [Acidimicrobiales bacterium]|nr:DUF4349 domain-containing protein [Acidimicrobiales bacterium]